MTAPPRDPLPHRGLLTSSPDRRSNETFRTTAVVRLGGPALAQIAALARRFGLSNKEVVRQLVQAEARAQGLIGEDEILLD
jgi:hypothetical protein